MTWTFIRIAVASQTARRVTEEAKVAETAVWPSLFLINMLTTHKGSQFHFYS